MEKVLYDESEQIAIIKFYAIIALNYARRCVSNWTGVWKDINDNEFSKWLEYELEFFGEPFADYMQHACSIIKNPTYYDEKEWRIYYNTGIDFDFDDGKVVDYKYKKSFYKYDLKPMDVSKVNGKEVEFADLSFARRIERGIISEIVIGNNCSLKESDIKQLLFDYEYTTPINIRKSKCSDRPR